ncbi:hypothetical protein T06_10039 [Trichinella sp. T6]|nr:hypothetical protein T06_10039 [Trichinella sp. T6]
MNKAKEQTEPVNAWFTSKNHSSPAKYQCPCCYSSNTSFSLAMPRADKQTEERIIKRKGEMNLIENPQG